MKTFQASKKNRDSYFVYKLTNKINGKVYIGMTLQNPIKRWKNGRGYNSAVFCQDIKRYGWDSFDREILIENAKREEAQEIEKKFIKLYKSNNPDCGYNVTKGGDGGGMLNHNHSDCAKAKISEARKKAGFTEEHKKHISEAKRGVNHHFAKKVYQFTKNGEFIREWEYMSQATKELRINKANIGEVCKGNRKSAGGFVWKYEKG